MLEVILPSVFLKGSDADKETVVRNGAASSFPRNKWDPDELRLHWMLPEDDSVRETDIPERFQQRFRFEPKVLSPLVFFSDMALLDNLAGHFTC